MQALSDYYREQRQYKYFEAGGSASDYPIVCLHGILGNADEWMASAAYVGAHGYRTLVPMLPFKDFPLSKCTVDGVVAYVRGFMESLDLNPVVIAGNSLGGQLALRYTLSYPESVSALVLSGSAGLYEVPLGTSPIRRRDRNYIRERAQIVFFNPAHATEKLVDRISSVGSDRRYLTNIIHLGRDSQRLSLQNRLGEINAHTALIWGQNDTITPPDVAEQFLDNIPNAELHFIKECGHAPMIEHPQTFGRHVVQFLHKIKENGTLHAV